MSKFLICLGCVLVIGCSTASDDSGFYLRDPTYRCSTVDDCAESISENVTSKFQPTCQVYSPSNRATIRVYIDREGFVEFSEIVSSSGDIEFNERAMGVISKSAPFYEIRGVDEDIYQQAREIQFVFVCESGL